MCRLSVLRCITLTVISGQVLAALFIYVNYYSAWDNELIRVGRYGAGRNNDSNTILDIRRPAVRTTFTDAGPTVASSIPTTRDVLTSATYSEHEKANVSVHRNDSSDSTNKDNNTDTDSSSGSSSIANVSIPLTYLPADRSILHSTSPVILKDSDVRTKLVTPRPNDAANLRDVALSKFRPDVRNNRAEFKPPLYDIASSLPPNSPSAMTSQSPSPTNTVVNGIQAPVLVVSDVLQNLLPSHSPMKQSDTLREHADIPREHSDIPAATYSNLPVEQAEKPTAHSYMPTKPSDKPKEYLDIPKEHADMRAEYSDIPTEHSDMPTTHSDEPGEHSDIPAEHHVMPTKHSDMQTEHLHVPTEHSGIQEEHSDIQAEHPDIAVEHSGIPAEHSDMPSERSEKLTEHSDKPSEYPNNPSEYSDKSSEPTEHSDKATKHSDIPAQDFGLRTDQSEVKPLGDNRSVGGQGNASSNFDVKAVKNESWCLEVEPVAPSENLTVFYANNMTMQRIEQQLPFVLPGGRWRPAECQTRHRVAILIPYRDRKAQLKTFLLHMHPFLAAQNLDYGIFVVEQAPGSSFSRGGLFNIGFTEVNKRFPGYYQCFIFHDVDLLPLDSRIMYNCSDRPRHLSSRIDIWNFTLPYRRNTGGVLEVSTEQFIQTNGYSNIYFGWGAEDDDYTYRMKACKLKVVRYPEWSLYTMIKHEQETPSKHRKRLLQKLVERVPLDGLTTLDYELLGHSEKRLYTLIQVQLDQVKVMTSFFNRALDTDYKRWWWMIGIAKRFGIFLEERPGDKYLPAEAIA